MSAFTRDLKVNRCEGVSLIVAVPGTGYPGPGARFVVPIGAPMLGVGDWITETAPVSDDSFLGVNRSLDPLRYSGFKFNTRGIPEEDGWRWAADQMAQSDAPPDTLLLGLDRKPPGTVDWKHGPVRAISTNEVLSGEAFLVTLDSWLVVVFSDGSKQLVCLDPAKNARVMS